MVVIFIQSEDFNSDDYWRIKSNMIQMKLGNLCNPTQTLVRELMIKLKQPMNYFYRHGISPDQPSLAALIVSLDPPTQLLPSTSAYVPAISRLPNLPFLWGVISFFSEKKRRPHLMHCLLALGAAAEATQCANAG